MLGDRTSHGGTVVEASQVTFTHNKPIARVGDKVTCPIPGHGTTVIVEGDPTMILDGKPVARHGDKCACGAVLISSQVVSTVGSGGGGASSPQAASQAQKDKAAAKGLITSLLPESHLYDIHFVVRDEDTGQPLPRISYKITLEDGSSINGVTDATGLTDKISSSKQQAATLEVHHYGDDDGSSINAHNRYDACCS